jgi:uncharacterized protein
MRITLTGATGFIGRHLMEALRARGDQLTVLTRSPRSGTNPRYLTWDASSAPPGEALEADAIFHLAGESVAQRWTPEVKRRIRSSRVESTRALVRGLVGAAARPKVLVSMSAIGIYGSRGDEVLSESSPPGSGFLEDTCVEWEREAQRAADAGIRVVNPRIGIVLGRDGGALKRMLTPFRMGVGGRLGSGDQWMSWVHVDDVAGLLLLALDRPDAHGPMNATAPSPVRNSEFTRELARALTRPALFPVPLFALKLVFGEMANVLISSQRVKPQAAIEAGYRYRFAELGPALENILRRARSESAGQDTPRDQTW